MYHHQQEREQAHETRNDNNNNDWDETWRRENSLRDVYDVSRAYGMFFFIVSFFFTYFFLATDYDNDNEDMDGATRDVEQQQRC